MKHLLPFAILFPLTPLIALPLHAAEPAEAAHPGKHEHFHGKVSAVNATSITITHHKTGESKTFSVEPATTVTLNKEPSSIDKLSAGMHAGVQPSADGKSAVAIHAHSGKPGHGSKLKKV